MRKKTQGRKILPVSLLLENRRCLVVGGGGVAARKVGHLLDAGARVTVVSPDLGAELARLKTERRIRHQPRCFQARDVKGQAVVFAATDRRVVNRAVLAACRRARVLCSAADAQWPEGDLVSPAVLRNASIVVAISTGGRSCAQAKAIKEKLATWLARQEL